MAEESIVLMGVGDVGPMREPLGPFSELVKPILAQADIRFAQCERVYSELGTRQVHAEGMHSRQKPHMAAIFNDANFEVVSCASNHSVDWGEEALLDSIARLRKNGLKTIGAGKDLEEARQPVMLECKGIKVAFLAYCSVLAEGYAAGPSKPGVAPLRAHTYYRPIEYQAGVPPRTVTVPYDEDLAGLVDDVKAAKKSADVVIVSLHWGIHFVPRMIADYQTTAAEAAFAAGCDLILGHHAHIPKGIGVHSGKVCFYSLSNFMMSSVPRSPASAAAFTRNYGVELDPDYPNLAYGKDASRSLIAKAVITKTGVKKVSFLPVQIDKQLRPEVLRRADPRFDDAVRYMDWASGDFDHKFSIEGDEVVVTAASK